MQKTELDIIQSKIYMIRGTRVMLDRDLATLYQVETKSLNQSVKRNLSRFPANFMFQLTKNEWDDLRSQIVTLEMGRGKYPKYLPYVFTEHGTLMLASILNSDIAIQINQKIIEVFLTLRNLISVSPEYSLLKEQASRIETEGALIKTNQTVESGLVSGKFIQLSKRIHTMSEVLDEFQGSHVVIRQPEGGINRG